MKSVFTSMPLPMFAACAFAVGTGIGHLVFRWIVRLTPLPGESDADSQTRMSSWCAVPVIGPGLSRSVCCYRGVPFLGWGTLVELVTGALFAGFVVAKLQFSCQYIPEVRPDEFWEYGRIFYHLVLLTLLMAATGADFRDYVIPDQIIVPGILFAIFMATASGDLQTVHLWVDANDEIPGVRGAFIPEWIKQHHHWHGLAWSVTGMIVGATLTWLVRCVASFLLGVEAMGFGDVTLMAMIGSFLGWQPVLVVLALAPFCGLVMAIGTRVFAGRTYVPFGPYLSLATLTVIFGWRWIWMFEIRAGLQTPISVRKLFGDWVAVLILVGIALGLLIVLLSLLRIYRSVPVNRSRRDADANTTIDLSDEISQS